MNYKNRKKKLQLHSALFQSFMEEPTYANFQTISNTATLDINGSFKMIIIKLIDQQKKVQMKVEKFQGIYEALIEVYARKDDNTDKIMRIMESAKDE